MNSITNALAKLTQVGITMVVTIGICVFLGKWLDEKIGTDFVFLAIFTILGVMAAFRNLYVMVILEYKKKEEEEKEKQYLNYKKDK